MPFLVSIIPGVGFSSAVLLIIISLIQWGIYRKKGYRRSRSIALFCFFSSLFAFEHCLVQARIFTGDFLEYYLYVSTFGLCVGMIFYIRALNYFIAVPNWLYRFYSFGALGLVAMVIVAFFAQALFGQHWFFIPGAYPGTTENYFILSYTDAMGVPNQYLNTIMSVAGFLTVFLASFLLPRVRRSSRDYFFIAGLMFSIIASVTENFLLPFTLEYFVPMVFYSNLFEAIRMNNLAQREYLNEKYSSKAAEIAVESEKYQNSNLTEERIASLAERIKELFEKEKLYTNPNLSSEDLARKIGIPSYQLSQVVNIGLKTTFFELLSHYRIDHVKSLLESDDHKESTIINIAYDSGFNSKSAFNAAFKKQTGMTPSAYRKQQTLS